MTHQEGIEQVIASILSLPKEALEAFCRGNPFDKLLRSYDEFTSKGNSLYRHIRGGKHYKMSKQAYEAFKSGLPASRLYGEHRIPLSIIKERLLQSDGSLDSVRSILRSNEVILITDEEQKRLDAAKSNGGLGLRGCLPHDGVDRIEHAGIELAKETSDNTLLEI